MVRGTKLSSAKIWDATRHSACTAWKIDQSRLEQLLDETGALSFHQKRHTSDDGGYRSVLSKTSEGDASTTSKDELDGCLARLKEFCARFTVRFVGNAQFVFA